MQSVALIWPPVQTAYVEKARRVESAEREPISEPWGQILSFAGGCFFLATPLGLWDLDSQTRKGTHTPCSA